MHRCRYAIVLASVLATAPMCWGAAGDFDPTFGSGRGVVTEVEEDHDAILYAVGRQPDGKLVAAGYHDGSQGPQLLVMRFGANGALDASFGTGGIVLTTVGGYYPYPRAVLVRSDDRIVVVLRAHQSNDNLALVRYEPDGTLDATFGTGGIVFSPLGTGAAPVGAAVLQPDDGIVVVAAARLAVPVRNDYDIAVARFASDGTLDPAFGVGGVAGVDDAGRSDNAAALVLEPDGGIVVAGYSWDDPADVTAGSRVVVARLDSTGALDAGFGSGGLFVPALGDAYEATALVRMSDGTFVLAGHSYVWVGPHDRNSEMFLLGLTAGGALNSAVGVGGVARPGTVMNLFAMVGAPDGKLVGFGVSTTEAFTLAYGVARFLADGTPDATFGDGGLVAVLIDPAGSVATAGLVDPDGNPVAVGYAAEASTRNPPYGIDYYPAIARFLGEPVPCASDADCGACESCGSAGACTFGPRTTCTAARFRGAKLSLDTPLIDRDAVEASYARQRMKLKWRGTTPLAFDPLTDDVGVCLYVRGRRALKAVAPAGGDCDGAPCWSVRTGAVLAYHDVERTPDGVLKARFTPTKAQVDVGGEDFARTVHGIPNAGVVAGAGSISVQVHGGGACLGATFTNPTPKLKSLSPNSYTWVGLRGTGQ